MSPNFNIQKLILAPLDWGLGHATRCIPLVRGLRAAGVEVIIAAEGAQAHLLRKEFPGIEILPLPGYRVRYSKHRWTLPFRLLLQLPRIRRCIRSEQQWLERVIDERGIQLVVSDNRYGFSSSRIPSVFITHQLTVKAPFAWAERIIQRVLYRYINRFSVCWVPDAAGGDNVAGVLSHPVVMPQVRVKYIGLLSRFVQQPEIPKQYDYCVLLSGPEPQRSLLEEKILDQLSGIHAKVLLVRGKPGNEQSIATPPNVVAVNHLPGDALQQALLQSEYIVCRSGYTTVMELLALHKKAILIPTPGQTEQEYLAEKLHREGLCMYVRQEALDCSRHFSEAKNFAFVQKDFDLFKASDVRNLIQDACS